MKILLFLALAVLSSSCTTAYYPDGKKFASISSNFKGTISGPSISISGEINNSLVVQKYGAAGAQGIMSLGGAFLSNGVIK